MKKISFLAIYAMCALTLVSCGNKSNSDNLPSEGLYGELPGMYLEYCQLIYDGFEKMKNATSKDEVEQIKEKLHADEDAFTERIAEAGKQIEGKEIQLEIGEGLPFKVVKMPVIGATNVKGIEMKTLINSAELESTDEIAVGEDVPGKLNRSTSLRVVAVDKSGTPLLYADKQWKNTTPSPTNSVMDPNYFNYLVPAGSTGSLALGLKYENTLWEMERLARVDHYVVVLKDSELGKQVEEAVKQAKEEAKEKEKK